MPGPENVGPRARLLIRGVLTGGGSQAGILLVSLLVTPVVVHRLGMERYGLWALAAALVSHLGLLDMGVGNGLVRYLAAHRARGDDAAFNGVLRLGLFFYGGFGVLLFPVVILSMGPLMEALAVRPELRGEISFLLAGVTAIFLLRTIFSVHRAALAAVERIDLNNKIAFAMAIPGGIGSVLAVTLGFGIPGLVVNGAVTAALAIVVQCAAAYRFVPGIRLLPFELDFSLAPELLGYGLRVQGTRLAELIYGQVDKVALGLLIGAVPVGEYDIGMKLSVLAAALPTLILPVILPTTSILAATGDREQLRVLHQRAAKYVALVVAPVTGYVIVAAPSILGLWIGTAVAVPAAPVARLLVLGGSLYLALGVSRLVSRGIGLPQLEMKAGLIMAAANVALTFALIPLIGPVGAPIGSCAAGLAGGLCFLVFFMREVSAPWGLDPLGPMLAPAISAGVAALGGAGGALLLRAFVTPSGRMGALLEILASGIPFVVIYAAGIFKGSLIDEYDQRVARETWSVARAALSRSVAAP